MIEATPFSYPYDGKLDPAAAALIVIDLQEDFLSETGYSPFRVTIPRRSGRSCRWSTR